MAGDGGEQLPVGHENRRRRLPLSRERVLKKALRYMDEKGPEALSMRRLASTLGVEAMALYRHVDNKDDLLLGVVDTLVAQIELPDDDLEWRSWIRELFLRSYDVYVRHPQVVPLLVYYSVKSGERRRIIDRSLSLLSEAGFDDANVHHIMHLLNKYLLGSALIGSERTDYIAEYSGDDRFPTLQRYAGHFHSCERRWEFERGLDLILDAFDRPPLQRDGESVDC